MPLAKGDVVLVPFPFTDLSQTKLRPAVVVHVNGQGRDITLCFVSSQKLDSLSADEFKIDQTDTEFAMTGLKVTSKVRVTRLVTLERGLLQRRLGKLGSRSTSQLNKALIQALQLSPK